MQQEAIGRSVSRIENMERHEETTLARSERLLDEVRELVPAIRARAALADEERQVSEATMRELRAVNAFRVLQPRRYGGLELGFDSLVKLAILLGEACSSTGWMAIVLNTGWMTACFSERAQEEVWGTNPGANVATSFTPTREIKQVEGGYRISGEWQFTSGVHHVEHVILGGLLFNDGPPQFLFFLVSKADFTIVDDWHTVGLRATGSATTVVRDVFVPKHRTITLPDLREGTTPGSKVHANPLYRAPLGLVFPISIASPVIGAAKGGLFQWREHMVKRRQHGIFPVHEYVPNQLRIAEAACEIESAELLLLRDAQEAMALIRSDEHATPEKRARSYRDAGYAVKLCQQAIERLFQVSGGHSVYAGNPIQRAWRDVHAAGAHVSLRWDEAAERWGRAELGLKQNNAFFY